MRLILLVVAALVALGAKAADFGKVKVDVIYDAQNPQADAVLALFQQPFFADAAVSSALDLNVIAVNKGRQCRLCLGRR